MQCHQFESRVNELLDRRAALESDSALMAHSFVCADCAEVLSGYQSLMASVPLLDLEDGEIGPADRILAVVGPTKSRGESAYAWYWCFAVAAAVVLGALPWLSRRLDTAAPPASASVTDLADHGQQSVPQTQEGAGDLWTAGRNERYLVMAEELAVRQLVWVEPVANGLRPVTSSMSAALSALRRTLPGSQSETTSS